MRSSTVPGLWAARLPNEGGEDMRHDVDHLDIAVGISVRKEVLLLVCDTVALSTSFPSKRSGRISKNDEPRCVCVTLGLCFESRVPIAPNTWVFGVCDSGALLISLGS